MNKIVEDRLRRDQEQAEERRIYEEQVRKVERRFADLSLVLQRAVQDAKLEGHETQQLLPGGKFYRGYFVPHEEWDEVEAALEAIDKYAREVAFGKD